MLQKRKFNQLMRSTLEHHLTLSNPLFKHLLNSEQPNLNLLKFTTLQGYQLTKHFLTYVENLFFHCPIERHKRALLHNLYEEETGALSNTKNHVLLMEDFIKAIGISENERDAAIALPTTQNLIEYRLNACQNKKLYHIGAAAVLVASEGQNLEKIGEDARHNILGSVYNLDEKDLLFFSVHQKEDVAHVKQGLALVTDLCTTETMQQEALESIKITCELFYNMYQGIYEHFNLGSSTKA